MFGSLTKYTSQVREASSHLNITLSPITDICSTVSRSKVKTVAAPAKSKAGQRVGTSRKKTSTIIQDSDSDSTELSDPVSGSDHDGKSNGDVEESEGLAQELDDDLDSAKLTEKETKQVLHEEVKNRFLLLPFYSFAFIATQRCFDSLR